MFKGGIWQATLFLVPAGLVSNQAFAKTAMHEDCADATSLIPCPVADAVRADSGATESAGRYRPWLPIFRDADETAWLVGIDYYAPQPGFDRENRDIDVENLRVARAWHFADGWEFQFGGAFFRASGTRTTNTSPPSLERSDALGVTVGPVVRWNFLQLGRVRLFASLGIGLSYTNADFPAGGTPWDFFLRGGAGASFRISRTNWVEAGFWWTHISNGTGIVPGNPAWQGRGVSVSLRHALLVKSTEHKGKGFPLLDRADEKAWVSEAEYFVPLSNRDLVDANLNIRAYRVARAWHFSNGFELQFGGTVFPSPMASGLGPLLRWNFVQRGRWRVFADGEADGIKDGWLFLFLPYPNFTQSWNVFFRTGGGLSYRLGKSYWLEAGYRWADTLGGANGETNYPSWKGQGVSITLRHTG
jgi:hypothetical protein